MNLYTCRAGGFHARGMLLIVAESAEKATEFANKVTNKEYGFFYYELNTKCLTTDYMKCDDSFLLEECEYGFPELPSDYKASNWSGRKYSG